MYPGSPLPCRDSLCPCRLIRGFFHPMFPVNISVRSEESENTIEDKHSGFVPFTVRENVVDMYASILYGFVVVSDRVSVPSFPTTVKLTVSVPSGKLLVFTDMLCGSVPMLPDPTTGLPPPLLVIA